MSRLDESDLKYCWAQEQQIAVRNDKAYVVGGLIYENRGLENGKAKGEYYANPDIWVFDFTKDTSADSPEYTNIPVPVENVPILRFGALWDIGSKDDDKLLMSQGQLQRDILLDSSNHTNTLYSLERKAPNGAAWEYSISSNSWKKVETTTKDKISAVKAAQAFSQKAQKGFVLNGLSTQNEYYILPPGKTIRENKEAPQDAVRGELANRLAVYDNKKKEWTVEEAPFMFFEGAEMVVLENAGDEGMLVVLGGATSSRAEDGISFKDILVYDIATKEWFNQSASFPEPKNGIAQPTPRPRREFCAVAASAPDGSSHNVYVYGGRAAYKVEGREFAPFMGENWVLSIPSFTWTQLPATPFNTQVDLACGKVGQKYMFAFTNNPVVNGKVLAGNERECTGKLDYQLLDLSAGDWTREYKAGQEYTVPKAIYSKIGGDEKGGATLVTPKGGFVNDAMTDLFKIKRSDGAVQGGSSNSDGSSSPGSSSASKGMSGGAIAGIVIGAIAAFALVAVILFLVRKKKRNARKTVNSDSDGPHEVYGYVPGEGNKPTVRAEAGPQVEQVYEADGTTTAAMSELAGNRAVSELDGYAREPPAYNSMAKGPQGQR
ncbi:hypothetical protein BJ508DRAFT_412880 [Ascobolus immersus RN42]|uniref:Kelch repeat protein n=1 Tax=Ascobolus immersus RN42 TaxID=1160509 RepID=A0A3N4IDF9_ASCIM|nr:hypothetical protein BJ508DRAFT_412880 [Ascobolus immersus RN42]